MAVDAAVDDVAAPGLGVDEEHERLVAGVEALLGVEQAQLRRVHGTGPHIGRARLGDHDGVVGGLHEHEVVVVEVVEHDAVEAAVDVDVQVEGVPEHLEVERGLVAAHRGEREGLVADHLAVLDRSVGELDGGGHDRAGVVETACLAGLVAVDLAAEPLIEEIDGLEEVVTGQVAPHRLAVDVEGGLDDARPLPGGVRFVCEPHLGEQDRLAGEPGECGDLVGGVLLGSLRDDAMRRDDQLEFLDELHQVSCSVVRGWKSGYTVRFSESV